MFLSVDKSSSAATSAADRRMKLLMLVVFVLYAVLRVVAWYNTTLLADTDSCKRLSSRNRYVKADVLPQVCAVAAVHSSEPAKGRVLGQR